MHIQKLFGRARVAKVMIFFLGIGSLLTLIGLGLFLSLVIQDGFPVNLAASRGLFWTGIGFVSLPVLWGFWNVVEMLGEDDSKVAAEQLDDELHAVRDLANRNPEAFKTIIAETMSSKDVEIQIVKKN